MTDKEFLAFFSGGLDLKGLRVTARIGEMAAHRAVAASLPTTGPYRFLIQVNHGEDIPVEFEPGEDYSHRMARVDAAVDRWMVLKGK